MVDVDKLKLKKRVSAWRCFALQEGIVKQIKNEELVRSMQGVDKLCLERVREGAFVHGLSDDTTKYGPILVSGDSREECFDILKGVEDTLEIVTENNGRLSSIIW